MKRIITNRKLITILSIILVIAIASVAFWKYEGGLSVKASGLISIGLSQSPSYAPGTELAAERTENSKKYYLANDSYGLDIAMGAIHYKDNYSDSQEAWKDIDLTFQSGKITKAPYILTVNQDTKSFTLQDKKTGKTASLKLSKVGATDATNLAAKAPVISTGKILWSDVATDLDIAITAENTRVSFDWIVKSQNAPHEVVFEVTDGGIPVAYRGVDADGSAVTVATKKTGSKVTETIASGGTYPKTINPTIDPQVNSSQNDCDLSWNGSSWSFSLDGGAEGAGYGGAYSQKMGTGLRFTNVTIPASSTITTSYLTLNAYYGGFSGTTVRTRITGNKENNPAVWSTLADYQARRGTIVGGADNNKITTAQVAWDSIPTWVESTNYPSPEIKTVIQELINAHAPNNEALALFWDDHDNRTTVNTGFPYRQAKSYTTNPAYAPKLHIEYSSASSISNTPSSYSFQNVDPGVTLSTGLNAFTITNNSANAVNITVRGFDITGGTTWTLSDSAEPGTATYGMKAGVYGGAYDVIVKKTEPFNMLKGNLAPSDIQGWGLQLLSPTNYTDSVQKAGVVTLTATMN